MFTKATENVSANIDLSKRTVEAVVARFDNVDHVRDRIRKGAFARTISTGRFSRGLVSTKYNHTDLIGKPIHAEETAEGLLMTFKVSPTKKGDEVLALMQDDALTTYSFKYTIDKDGQKMVTDPDGTRVRELKSLELWEAGPVDPDLAVNDATYTLGFKGPLDAKGLYDLAEAVSALSRLEGADSWAKEMYGYLSDEDKAALRAMVDALPGATNTIKEILSAGEGKSAPENVNLIKGFDLSGIAELLKARTEAIRAALS